MCPDFRLRAAARLGQIRPKWRGGMRQCSIVLTPRPITAVLTYVCSDASAYAGAITADEVALIAHPAGGMVKQ